VSRAPTASGPGVSGGWTPPKVDLVRLVDIVVRDVDAAYEAAAADPGDPAVVGELGMYYYSVEQPLAAAACFTRAAELEPTALPWRYYLGLAYLAAFDAPSAVRAFEDGMALDPRYPPLLLALASQRLEQDTPRARALYQSVIENSPDDPRGYLGLGRCAELARDLEGAIREYRRALAVAPDDPNVRTALAKALESAGRRNEAAEHRRRIRSTQPAPLLRDPLLVQMLKRTRNPEFLTRLGQELGRAGRFEEAVTTLQRAIETDKTLTTARENLGIVFAMMGETARAAEEFRRVVEVSPSNLAARAHHALALSNLGRREEAERIYLAILAQKADEPLALGRYGVLLLQTGRTRDALRYLAALADAAPDEASSHLDLAMARACARQFDGCVDAYRRGRDLLPRGDDAPGRFVRQLIRLAAEQATHQAAASQATTQESFRLADFTGLGAAFAARGMDAEAARMRDYRSVLADEAMAMVRGGRAEAAQQVLAGALETDRDGSLRKAMGAALAARGKWGEAASELRQALRLRADLPGGRAALARVLQRAGKPDEAEAALREELARTPDNVALMRDLAVLLDKRGKPADAEAMIRSALSKQPDDAVGLHLLGRLLARAGRDTEALPILQQASRAQPQNADIHYELGALETRAGRSAQAVRCWLKAIALQPAFVDARRAYATACMQTGDFATAARVLKEGLNFVPDSVAMINSLAWILSTCPDESVRSPKLALPLARKACDLTANSNPKTLDTLAAAYAATGDFPNAVATAEKAVALWEKQPDAASLAEARRRAGLYKAGEIYRPGS
jgi:tetratricopeptide (TPR) repeat protein